MRAVARALEQDEVTAGRLGQGDSRGAGPVIASAVPWITSTGQRTRAHNSRAVSSSMPSPKTRRERVSAVVSRPQPTQSSICLVECGSVNIWEKKNSRKPW